MFLSGFLTAEDLGGKTYSEFLSKRLLRVIPSYVFWSVFFTAVKGTWREFPVNLLTGRCEGIYYFIFVYIQLVVLTPLAVKLMNTKCKVLGWIASPISIVLVYYIIGNMVDLYFPLSGELFVFWFTYYYLGLYIRNKSDIFAPMSTKNLSFLYGASLILQYIEGFLWLSLGNEVLAISQMRISSFVSSILFAVLVVRFIRNVKITQGNKGIYVLKTIGDYSYGMYLIHMAVIRGLMKIGIYDGIVFPLSWVVILAITAFFIHLVKMMFRGKFAIISRIVTGG